VDSFVDYFILTEISKNVDGYRLSTFMYKDKDSKNGRLTMGPVWDYNFAFGNVSYYNAQYTWGWQVDSPIEKYRHIPFWWEKLLSSQEFADRMVTRWREARQNILSDDRMMFIIDSLLTELDEARQRNFERWPLFEDNQLPDSYEEEIAELKNWLTERLSWIDNNISSITSTGSFEKKITPVEITLYQNHPNPFNPSTRIKFTIPEAATVKLNVYNTLGQTVDNLIAEDLPAGLHEVEFNAGNLPSGVYFYRLQAGEYDNVKKMIVIR
jgi:hypothetical protein